MHGASQKRRRGFSRRLDILDCRRDQRSSCSTLCWDWLASASAETAIDWRVDSAWLLAASSLVSASVRLAEPVCSTLIRFFEKSWRICTIDRFEPRVEACVRNASDALVILAIVALAEALSRKSVPPTNEARPRPAALKVTPLMVRVDLPVSLKVSLRSSPFSRLIPLNEASCAVVVICVMTLLYWLTRLARMVCEAASASGWPAAPPVGVTRVAVSLPLIAMVFAAAVVPVVRVWLALSLVEVSVMEPSLAKDAVNPRPAADSAVLKASIELTFPAATVLLIVIVVAAPVAGVKTKFRPLSEFVPTLVKSPASPGTANAPAPVGAAVVADAFTE